jgi:hypothetical protein
MKANRLNLWLAISLLLAAGCGGARTPLDELATAELGGSTYGGGAVQGGDTGMVFGGSLGTGGVVGTAGGFAGATAPTGGVNALGGTGGFFPFGGTAVVGGYIAPTGGRSYIPPTGGTSYIPPTGGTTYIPPTGGTIALGGRGGTGGATYLGGTTEFVGGSTAGRSGTLPLGGTMVGGRGGTVATGGTVPLGGSVVGGRGGTLATGGVGGTVGGTTCPGLAPNEELIDDMNDGDRFIPQVNGRAGAWKDGGDATSSSTMFPNPAGPFTMTNTGDACRKFAAYVYGGPFVDGSPLFYFGIGGPYDASKYDGISFWAKIDSGSSAGLRVAFPDKDTQPDGGLCQLSGGANQCYDHYGYRIPAPGLTTQWAKYTVFFNSLTTDGWGRAGAGFDRSTIYEVQFQLPGNATFGVWVDDVALVIGTSN